MVYEVLGSVRGLVKFDRHCIDNNVFRLHYKATVIFLVAFSLLVTSNQYFGDPIDCIQRFVIFLISIFLSALICNRFFV